MRTSSLSFNNRQQPVNMSAVTPGATVFSLNYDFHNGSGNNGNVFGITSNKDTTRNQTFTYDALNRLTNAQNAGTDCTKATLNGRTEYWGNSYTYDAWGNLIGKNVTKCSAENLTLTALANNQLSGYSYDAAGNMTHDLSNGGVNYSYDQENRITGAAGYTYTYDADGNRVEKSNGSTGTLYWYMTPGIVAESDLAGNLQSEYVFFDGERVARKDFPSGNIAYYFSDNLKTASVITDATGNIKSESDYYPWGGELQFANSDSNRYKFTGKERDSETQLDYLGLRYYGNRLGRFTSPDPDQAAGFEYTDDPQAWNGYSYARNNPLMFVDPDGATYRVCDEHGENCSTQNDAEFDENEKTAQQNGEVWKNGQIFVRDANGNLQNKGSYTDLGPDIPGDPEANRKGAALIVGQFNSTLTEFGKNAAYAATGGVIGRAIGAAVESIRAIRVVENLPATTHAALRMAQRGITQQALDYAVESAERVGNVVTKTGQYGTTQEVYTGTNGITVVVETEGRNAGKAVSAWWTRSKP